MIELRQKYLLFLGDVPTQLDAKTATVNISVKTVQFASVAGGGRHACALTMNGVAYELTQQPGGLIATRWPQAPEVTGSVDIESMTFLVVPSGTDHVVTFVTLDILDALRCDSRRGGVLPAAVNWS
ncbi:MAG: hypothetical protein IH805_03940 [Proteobacteria bacterium]|nr:hypothetical protein [Pseudomonadota bacterium]